MSFVHVYVMHKKKKKKYSNERRRRDSDWARNKNIFCIYI